MWCKFKGKNNQKMEKLQKLQDHKIGKEKKKTLRFLGWAHILQHKQPASILASFHSASFHCLVIPSYYTFL